MADKSNETSHIKLDESEVIFMPYKSVEKAKEAKRKYDEKRVGRTRNFATVVYPESAPDNWKNRLEQLFIPALISPLHDRDTNPGGEPKKAHYHVLLMFESVKTREQVSEIVREFGGVGCEKVNSLRGMARYLCHLDNPDKAQYNTSEIQQFGGVDYTELTQLASDKRAIRREITGFCRKYGITSFARLLDYADEYEPVWSEYLDSNAYLVKEYLASQSWSILNNANFDIAELRKRVENERGNSK